LTKVREVYKCKVCGNIVEVLHEGVGELVCCDQPMELLQEKTEDSSTEKHVPYLEKTEEGVLIKIGQNEQHPMIEKHYIEWIELIADGRSYRKFLQPGEKPEAFFCIQADTLKAREYCNVHGLWKS
jgi:superoxide reductase